MYKAPCRGHHAVIGHVASASGMSKGNMAVPIQYYGCVHSVARSLQYYGCVHRVALELTLIRIWFKLPVHTTIKTGFAQTASGGGFDEFGSVESNLPCSVDRGIGPRMRTNGEQAASFSVRRTMCDHNVRWHHSVYQYVYSACGLSVSAPSSRMPGNMWGEAETKLLVGI